ncbi:MAG: thiol protease/hemagglutinin PrtT [Bacteroidales bacterium]|nr:thiol protease/hemagglutinin PrtT [Bacteroidales bacterium]
MRKTLFLMMTLALCVGQLIASPVDVEQARHLGLKYVQGNTNRQVTHLDLAYTQTTESGSNALYVFNFDGGYIIVAADDVALPILAFGEEGCFDANNIADGLAYYLRFYARQIEYAVSNNMTADPEVAEQWEQISNTGVIQGGRSTRSDVAPLISTNWNQDNPYNFLCPTAPNGPGGHVYAGCVATAMSMVMKYWNWPDHGQGSHSYTPSGYPMQSVDFENTYYQWSNMPNSCNNSNYQAVATLMWHCGVAVNMQYGYNGSGAYSADVPDAISNYFRYTKSAIHLDRDSYTKLEWEEMLIANLQEGFPLYYSGSDNGGGHAFVCCGYRESDRKFYFNWGWSGFNNNYFAIDALNTYSGHFNEYQTAIFDMIPDYVYDGLVPAVGDLNVVAENAQSKKGIVSWTNPLESLDGNNMTNIEQVVLLRNGQQVFTQSNVVPGEVMQFEDIVPEYDCYTYRLYFVTNGTQGRPAEFKYQFGPTCSWKIVGQTTNFQGWNGGKIQLKNAFGTVIEEVTMTSSTPISQQIRVPEGTVTFTWVAPSSPVSNLTINIKNSSNGSVYTYTGNSNQVPATLYTGDNDCDGCQPPTNLSGEYQWTNEGFGTLLRWDYEVDPQSFKVYRSEDGVAYELVATVDKTLREYFDLVDAGDYYYQVTAYRSYCESTPAWTGYDTDYVHVEVTSVSENDEAGLSLYPNPANTLMSVEAEGLEQVTICNVMGQVVMRQHCTEDGVVINTSDLASGLYTITVKAAQGTMTKRFAVMH